MQRPPSLCILTTAVFILVLLPQVSYSAPKGYYYVHVASFQSESNAEKSAQALRQYQVNAIVRKENVPNKGEWYRLYIGPYFTREDAEVKGWELKQKNAITYASVQKKEDLMETEPPPRPRPVISEKKPSPPRAEVGPQPTKPLVQEPVLPRQPATPKQPATPTQPSPLAHFAEVSTKAEKEEGLGRGGKTDVLDKQAKKEEAEPAVIVIGAERPEKTGFKGPAKTKKGRNLRQGEVAFGDTYRFRYVETLITSRRRTESSGTTTTTAITLPQDQKDDFPSRIHLDTVVLRYGLTPYLDIHGEVGVSYDDDELSGLGLVYGGGLRLNVFQMQGTENSTRYYAALLGEYYTSEFEKDFISTMGSRYKRDTDWQDITGKLEFGMSQSRWDVYIGGTYLNYQEDTNRQQLDNLPATIHTRVFHDELEQQEDFGIFGGLCFRFTPHLMLNIEGRALDYKSISGSLEHRF